MLPPAPRGVSAARAWQSRDLVTRRRLARAGPATIDDLAPADRALVAALAERRIQTGWRLYAAAAGLGWLVLMTVWGIGRTTADEGTSAWLVAGLVLAVVTAGTAAFAAWRRLQRAHATRHKAVGGSP